MQFEEIDGIGKFNYKMLMSNEINLRTKISKMIIKEYNKLDTSKHFMINLNDKKYKEDTNEPIIYENIKKELLSVCDDKDVITNTLIEYLYKEKKSSYKITLWECFGDVILNNLWNNIVKKEGLINPMQCVECGKIIEKMNNKTKYCSECRINVKIKNDKLIQKRRYSRK